METTIEQEMEAEREAKYATLKAKGFIDETNEGYCLWFQEDSGLWQCDADDGESFCAWTKEEALRRVKMLQEWANDLLVKPV